MLLEQNHKKLSPQARFLLGVITVIIIVITATFLLMRARHQAYLRSFPIGAGIWVDRQLDYSREDFALKDQFGTLIRLSDFQDNRVRDGKPRTRRGVVVDVSLE